MVIGVTSTVLNTTAELLMTNGCLGMTMTNDNVNSPAHYNVGNLETIQLLEESMSKREFLGYLKGNVIKYLARYEYKGKPMEDLDKALWYLEYLSRKRKEYDVDLEFEKGVGL